MGKRANGEGSIRQRADGRWEATFSYFDADVGKTKRASAYGRTQALALAGRSEKLKRLEAGQPLSDAVETLASYTARWIETTLQASARKASTKATYAAVARNWIVDHPIGTRPLAKVAPRDVEAWIAAAIRGGRSQTSARQSYTILRAVFDTAVRDGLVARNPATAVDRPAAVRTEARMLTVAEVEAVLVAGDRGRCGNLFRVIAYTGIRRGEAMALRWSDVDLDLGTLYVRGTIARAGTVLLRSEPKTTASRRLLPIGPKVVEALRAERARQAGDRAAVSEDVWEPLDLVFTTQTGGMLEPGNVSRVFRTAAKHARLTGQVGLHTLRHSAASYMLAAGVPLLTVSRMLGHGSISVTADIYGHVTTESAMVASRTLEGAYS